jgi:hypothetical protein
MIWPKQHSAVWSRFAIVYSMDPKAHLKSGDLRRRLIEHGAMQIDVEGLVRDAHRTATQLDRFPVFASHQFILLNSWPHVFRCCRLDHIVGSRRLAGLDPPTKSLRSMQTGQNSIAPENSLPQGQVRWDSVLMDLTALQSQSEREATPHSTEWGIDQQGPGHTVVPVRISLSGTSTRRLTCAGAPLWERN